VKSNELVPNPPARIRQVRFFISVIYHQNIFSDLGSTHEHGTPPDQNANFIDIKLCPLCNLEGQILNKFWFKEKIYRCQNCALIYRERIYSEKRNPDILANYLNDSNKDDKNNGIKLLYNDILKENLKSKVIILDFGAGSRNIKKLEAILKVDYYNKDLIQYLALDIDLNGRYILKFSDKLFHFSDLFQVFSF
jgi:Zn-finger protein